jgi:hypothetical protein
MVWNRLSKESLRQRLKQFARERRLKLQIKASPRSKLLKMLQKAAQDVDLKAEEVIKKFFGTLRPRISATGNAMYKIG